MTAMRYSMRRGAASVCKSIRRQSLSEVQFLISNAPGMVARYRRNPFSSLLDSTKVDEREGKERGGEAERNYRSLAFLISLQCSSSFVAHESFQRSDAGL